jgi:hypothetical protein
MIVEQPSLTDCRFASMHEVLSTYTCVCVDYAKKVKRCPLCKKHIRQRPSVVISQLLDAFQLQLWAGERVSGAKGGAGDVIELSDNDE